MELLKQPLGKPMSLAHQVITLVAAIGKRFLFVEKNAIKKYQADILKYFDKNHKEIVDEINETKVLNDELKEKILKALDEFEQQIG